MWCSCMDLSRSSRSAQSMYGSRHSRSRFSIEQCTERLPASPTPSTMCSMKLSERRRERETRVGQTGEWKRVIGMGADSSCRGNMGVKQAPSWDRQIRQQQRGLIVYWGLRARRRRGQFAPSRAVLRAHYAKHSGEYRGIYYDTLRFHDTS